MWDLLTPYHHLSPVSACSFYLFYSSNIYHKHFTNCIVLAGNHLGTCHPQWPEDESGCSSVFGCFRLLWLYSQTICWKTTMLQNASSILTCPFVFNFLKAWEMSFRSREQPSVKWCQMIGLTSKLIVVLFRWTRLIKHEPQIVTTMIDPPSMNHYESLCVHIALHSNRPLTSWPQPWHPWLHCMATHVGSCRGAPEIEGVLR